ncbi:hypothetical protein [Mycobacterium sp. IS-3022]|nr:hypothetical protein [Mycobacterium sp. IS-3022]
MSDPAAATGKSTNIADDSTRARMLRLSRCTLFDLLSDVQPS